MADTAFAVVVELKRPGDTSGLKELGQLEGYVDYLTSREKENTDPHGLTRKVSGCLVYTKMLKGTEEKVDRLRRDGMYIVTWDKLLETTERLHREYLRIVKSRAPEDDPRVQQLGIDGDDGEETPAES